VMGEVAAARFSDPGSIPGASIGFNIKKAHVYAAFRVHGLLLYVLGLFGDLTCKVFSLSSINLSNSNSLDIWLSGMLACSSLSLFSLADLNIQTIGELS